MSHMAASTQPESVHLQDVKEENVSIPAEAGKDFDNILELVGSIGTYQRLLLYGIMVPLSVFESVITLNLWFLMDEPPHWCHVPGREASGLDLHSWRNLTIPRDSSSGKFSKCEMYSPTNDDNSTLGCNSGWEYDVTDVNGYRSILADYNWVCDKGLYATWVLTATTAGRALGTLLLGWLADKIGRKSVFIIILCIFSFGRGIALLVPNLIWIFVALSFFVGMCSPMFAVCLNTITLELSGKDYRAWIFSCTWMTVVGGVIAVPVIALLVPNWIYLGWITVSIGTISFLLLPWIPESPRWLLTRGRIDEVVKILKEIARWNGTSGNVSDEELKVLLEEEDTRRTEENEGSGESVWKLFHNRNMAKNTLLVIFAWMLNGLVFHGLTLNSLNLHGHRYLSFVLSVLVEIPAGFFGAVLSDKFGRRWSQVAFFMMSGAGCVVAAMFSGDESTSSVVVLLCAANFAKFSITMSFLIIYLQATEVFPTPLRTTGAGFASTTASVMQVIIPYIVYAGKSSTTLPWIMSGSFSFAGMVAAAFIPETKNKKLPETISDAENFGKGNKFWSFRLSEEDS